MDKVFEHWQSLIRQYRRINEEIQVYEKRNGEYRFVSLQDHDPYQSKLKELHDIIEAMGTEFPEAIGELVNNLLPIVTAAYALKGYESVVLIVRTEAKRLNALGFTATSEQLYMAARLLDLLFVEINKEK